MKKGLYFGRRENDLYELAQDPEAWDGDEGFCYSRHCWSFTPSDPIVKVIGVKLKPKQYFRIEGPVPHGRIRGGRRE